MAGIQIDLVEQRYDQVASGAVTMICFADLVRRPLEHLPAVPWRPYNPELGTKAVCIGPQLQGYTPPASAVRRTVRSVSLALRRRSGD